MPNLATASDLPFYDTFVHKKLCLWWWKMESWQTKNWEIGRKKTKNPWSRLFPSNHYSLLICRYTCIMMSQITVTTVANCDVITIAYRCQEPRTIVACHIIKKILNGNNCDTLAENAPAFQRLKIPDFSHIAHAFCMQRQ